MTIKFLERDMRMLFLRAILVSALLCLSSVTEIVQPSEPAQEPAPLSTLVPTIALPPKRTPEPTKTPLFQPVSGRYDTYLPQVGLSGNPFVARNVILLIGDGMGLEHVKAAGIYLNGAAGTLPFEQFPLHARLTTASASSPVTDSAAAASAVATGRKVNNSVISEEVPGSGGALYTLLEMARDHGLATGLVTTTPITDATPASFGAHAASRQYAEDIAFDYINHSRPNVLFGGGHPAMTFDMAQGVGYTVVTNQAELLALDTEAQQFVAGQFGHSYLPYETDGLGGLPHLSEMTDSALRILDNDPDGFFLMVEGGRIDTASHNQETQRMLGEMAEFARASQVVIAWAQQHPDTLIIVLADHETGGPQVKQNSTPGAPPIVTWSTSGHTAADVGIWVSGGGHTRLPEQLDNTQIFDLVTTRPVE